MNWSEERWLWFSYLTAAHVNKANWAASVYWRWKVRNCVLLITIIIIIIIFMIIIVVAFHVNFRTHESHLKKGKYIKMSVAEKISSHIYFIMIIL